MGLLNGTKKPVISLIGECMVELREEADGRLSRGFGGDVLNTAVYLSRLIGQGAKVQFATVMGDDPYSNELVSAWQSEGVNCDLVGIKQNSCSGLYIIKTDEEGERSFHYWRSAAPAREFMSSEWSALQAQVFENDWIYLSGISIAILGEEGRKRLQSALKEIKNSGRKIVFDGNYRPILWESREKAKYWYEQFWELCDVALAGAEDEHAVFEDGAAETTLNRLLSYRISEVVVKQGTGPVLLGTPSEITEAPIKPVMNVVDTTAAGDSFNAGYLYGRMTGQNMMTSARLGATLSASVIQHAGAIIPKTDMPEMEARDLL
ncbi:hypothetical protein A9Q83_16275 [Alphaproteobacteria bacterium 46_93_T64]|nr:hypothetical protein A9Q83_16275 [Alphaproteobacteria bacterium 46_93_T64]